MLFAGILAGVNRKNTRLAAYGAALLWGSSLLPAACMSFLPQVARAEGSIPQTSARYQIKVHGLHVLTAEVAYRLGGNAYSGIAQVQTAGLFGLFVQTDMRMQGAGSFWANGLADPAQYDSAGTYKHEQSHLHMVYHNGVPQITVQEPAQDDREDVTPAERSGAQDIVAVLVGLLHQLQTGKRCQELPQKLFDGLRLSTLSVRNTGVEAPPVGASKDWGKQAVTCNFVLQQVKGFKSEFSKLKQPQIGRVWFEDIPNIGMSVVRMEVEHPKMGHIIIRLNDTPKRAP